MLQCLIAFISVVVFFISAVSVQAAEDKLTGDYLQVDYYYAELSQGYDPWQDYLLNYVLQVDSNNMLRLEFSAQSHFKESGVLVGVENTRVINDWWYGSVHVATSSGGFFLPRKRMDLSLSKKWLTNKSLISTLAYTYYDAKDSHYDNNYALELIYYFPRNWVISAGFKLNNSQPGAVVATRKILAITYGRNKERYLVFKVDDGTEAYQIIGPENFKTEFASTEYSFTWREWLTKRFGINALVNHYSASYARNGVQLGVFYEY